MSKFCGDTKKRITEKYRKLPKFCFQVHLKKEIPNFIYNFFFQVHQKKRNSKFLSPVYFFPSSISFFRSTYKKKFQIPITNFFFQVHLKKEIQISPPQFLFLGPPKKRNFKFLSPFSPTNFFQVHLKREFRHCSHNFFPPISFFRST